MTQTTASHQLEKENELLRAMIVDLRRELQRAEEGRDAALGLARRFLPICSTAPRTINPGFDGMDARRKGLSVDACPYDPGPQRTAWVVGWYIANSEKDA